MPKFRLQRRRKERSKENEWRLLVQQLKKKGDSFNIFLLPDAILNDAIFAFLSTNDLTTFSMTSRRAAAQVLSFRGELPYIVREEQFPTQMAYEHLCGNNGCCFVDQVRQFRFLLQTERHGVVQVNVELGNSGSF